MTIQRLDHYSIRTTKLDETRRFYTEIVGLTDGYRPQFDFPGAWLYSGERAVVHVVGIDPDNPEGLIAYLGDKAGAGTGAEGTGTIDHVAFFASDLDGMLKRLKERGFEFRERAIPTMSLHQVFLEDPNGVTIELNYSTAAAEAA
jgi:catechol 2,3-dioxygenase-like lactoylglutathione lyase family enzyme